MNLRNRVSLLIGFLCVFGFSQQNLYNSETITPELKENANAVLRLDSLNVQIESVKEMQITYHRIVTVLNERGNRYVRAVVGYDPYRKIKKIEARIFDRYGKEIKKIKKKDFVDHSAVDGGTLYSDSRMLFMGYTPVSYPYTVSFSYEMETPNTAAIPTWRPYEGFFIAIEKSVLVIEDPIGLGLRFKEKNCNNFNIKVDKSDTIFSYELKNALAIKPEDLSPSIYDITPVVMVAASRFHYDGVNGSANDWVEFGDWMISSLLEGRDIVTGQTKQEILNLVNGIDDPIEKAKLIYKYVQENTRYISVQVGIGGIQPIEALEVDRLKYGDCKGLTNYTQALLQIAGVKSYYSVVESGQNIENLESDFASLEQGNHIILAIPTEDKYEWIDCTSQLMPFGFLGDFTDNRKVLVVKEGSSEIVRTVSYSNSDNLQTTKAEVALTAQGDMSAKVKIENHGIQYDNRFGLELQDAKDVSEFYMHYWSNLNNLKIKDYTFNNDKNQVVFEENVELEAESYAAVNDNQIIFAVNMFSKSSFIPKRYRQRKLPLHIQRGYLDISEFDIQIPEGFRIEALPNSVNITNKFGTYKIDIKVENEQIFYKRELLINKGTFASEDYEEYRKFRRKVAKQDRALIIINKN